MAEDNKKINEPEIEYEKLTSKKKITFFNSFQGAEEYGLREMANHGHEERLRNLEILRKSTYSHLLLPDGKWPPLKRIITIDKGIINEI
jgi:hypothetical protein